MGANEVTTYEPIRGGIKVIAGTQSTSYFLSERPAIGSAAIEDAKKGLKTKLNIEKIGTELEHCVDLLEVAYYAVNGISNLQSSVSVLQSNLLSALDDSVDVMSDFKVNTGLIIKDFFFAYKFLQKQNSEKALEKFKNAEKYALEMVEKFNMLRTHYKDLAQEAKDITEAAVEAKAGEYKNKKEILSMRNQMEAEVQAFESLKKSYAEQIEKLEKEYTDLNKKLEKAEDRQFALELTGIIIGGLSTAAVGIMGASIYGNGKNAASILNNNESGAGKPEQSGVSGADQQKGDTEISKDLSDKKKEKEKIDSEVKEKKATYEEAQKKVEESVDDTEKETLKAERDKALKELNEVQQRQKNLQDMIGKLQEGCSAVTESCQKAADSQGTIIDNYNARIEKVFELKYKIREKEIENLSSIAKYTKLIADSHITEDAVDLAIKSLIIAVTCMRNIEAILHDIVDFWSKLAAHCKELGSSGMADYIELAEGQDLTQDLDLVQAFFVYLINWTALESVAVAFLTNVETSKAHLRDTIAVVELSREKAWEKAPQIAQVAFKKMNLKLEEEKAESQQ